MNIAERAAGPPVTISERIAAIERDVDDNRYSPGPWARLVKEIRGLPVAQRRDFSRDLTRVSRKLHERGGRSTMHNPERHQPQTGFALCCDE